MSTFSKAKTTKKDFAQKAGISKGYLQHLFSGIKSPSVKLSKKIEEATGGKMTKEELLFPKEYP